MRVSAITKPTPRSSSPSSAAKIRARSRRRYWTHTTYGDLCDPPTIAGAGFINFTLAPGGDRRARPRELLRDERLGVEQAADRRNAS